jgi:hypothetical protein
MTDDRLCLCNHPESAHQLVTDDVVQCQSCPCDRFEWDPVGPDPRHSQHTVPVVGCDQCDDLLDEAREVAGEEWFIG